MWVCACACACVCVRVLPVTLVSGSHSARSPSWPPCGRSVSPAAPVSPGESAPSSGPAPAHAPPSPAAPRPITTQRSVRWEASRQGAGSGLGVRGQGSGSGVRGQGQGSGSGVRVRAHLVDVRDELALAGGVHLLVVGPHPALDGEQKDLQVPLLCEPETTATTITIIITSSSPSSPSPP